MHDIPQHPHRIIVAHVLKVHVVHLAGGAVGQRWGRGAEGPGLGQRVAPPQLTCKSMSPGSMRPSAATAPPFMMEPI